MRPSKVYKGQDRQPFTRRKYIKKGVDKKLMKMVMGDSAKQDFPIHVKLIAQESINISEHSLESVRTNINRRLLAEVGKGEPEHYRFEVVPYPHHYARAHGLVGVMKGERFCKGMRLSFGKVERRMARVKKGQVIFIISLEDKNHIQVARELLRIARCKLPKISQKYRVEIDQ